MHGNFFTFVHKARRDWPEADVCAGQSYYWWLDEFGTKRFSRLEPKPEQYLWESTKARLAAEEEKRRHREEQQAWTLEFLAAHFGGRYPHGRCDGSPLAAWTPAAGTVAPRADARVEVVWNPPDFLRGQSSCRHRSEQFVTGDPVEVAAYVQHVVLSDTCTMMYEHMLWHLAGVESQKPFTVRLSKSHYAGD